MQKYLFNTSKYEMKWWAELHWKNLKYKIDTKRIRALIFFV